MYFCMSDNFLSAFLWKGKILLFPATVSFKLDTLMIRYCSCLGLSIPPGFCSRQLVFWHHQPNILVQPQPTGQIWLALTLLHSSYLCFFPQTHLRLHFLTHNTTFHLISTFIYLWEETINVTTTSYVEDSFVACAFFLDLLFLI